MTLTAKDVERLLNEAEDGDQEAQAEIDAVIADLEWAERHSLDAAADGERVAADPNESKLRRLQASTAAGFAREHALEYAGEGDALRAGENPWAHEIYC